ncbi:MAG: class I SAM-dependent methyltransferase [Mesorhizobium sp.]
MWDERYSCEDYVFGTEPNAFLASCAPLLEGGRSVLCVADGEGRNSVWLAQQGLTVTAFDFSGVGIAKARKLAEARGVAVDYRQASIEDWDWEPERFDIVAAIFIQFAEPPLRSRIFEGMKRTLKPGGLLLMQGYRPEQIEYATGGPRARENLYTRALLEEAFAGFEILRLDEHDSEIHEGPGHAGMSALIDLVARKPAA